MSGKWRKLVRRIVPNSLLSRYIYALQFVYKVSKERKIAIEFIRDRRLPLSYLRRLVIMFRFFAISTSIPSLHKQAEILQFVRGVLLKRDVEGCIVEAGAYKGGSAAKFSIIAKLVNKQFVIFDSYRGLPESQEPWDRSIVGTKVNFSAGRYHGSLNEVRENIERYGEIGTCRFVEGWFEDTMPDFSGPVAAAYLDVDLASSTKTCLKYLYPLLSPGGAIYTQDAHLPLVRAAFTDGEFWLNEVGCSTPRFIDLPAGMAKIEKNSDPEAEEPSSESIGYTAR